MNSYGVDIASRGGQDAMWTDGDFLVRLVGCENDSNRECEKEFEPFYEQWKKKVGK